MDRLHRIFMRFILFALAIEVSIASTTGSADSTAPEARVSERPEAATPGASKPIRVAALVPWVGDAVTLAGGQAVLVAAVRRELHHALSDDLIDLGNPHSPNLERIAEARPDVVVGDAAIHARWVVPIEKSGARVLLLETASVEQTFEALGRLSRELGGSATLDSRIADARARLSALAGSTDTSLVALFGSPGTFYVMTERTWLGDLARMLGFAQAIASEGNERFPGLVAISDESMARARPDLVLLVAHGDPEKLRAEIERKTAGDGAWSGLARAKRGIHVLDPGLFGANPGLAIVQAAEMLVDLGSGTATGSSR